MSVTQRMHENAHKFAFLAKHYPQHDLPELVALMALPSIDVNAAIWVAVDEGLISEPTPDNKLDFLKAPKKWNFGENVADLKTSILYCFNKLAASEVDLAEQHVQDWTTGYMPHDVLVALKSLIEEKKLATYELVDPKDTASVYTFYSLFENSEQLWGKKQFKEQPTGEEVATDPDAAPIEGEIVEDKEQNDEKEVK